MESSLRSLRTALEKASKDLDFLSANLDADFTAATVIQQQQPGRRRSKTTGNEKGRKVATPPVLLRRLDALEKAVKKLRVEAAEVAQAKAAFAAEALLKITENKALLDQLSFGAQVEPDDETAGSVERFEQMAAVYAQGR